MCTSKHEQMEVLQVSFLFRPLRIQIREKLN